MKYVSSIELSTNTFNWFFMLCSRYPAYKQWLASIAIEQGAKGVYKFIDHIQKHLPEMADHKPNPFELSKAVNDGAILKEQAIVYFKSKQVGPVA